MRRRRSKPGRLTRTRGRGPAPLRLATGFCEAERAILPNGLRVLTVPARGLHSAMIALYVRAGSRHETVDVNGVSHFLEHLFFRGSEAWPDTVAMNAAVESVGGTSTASPPATTAATTPPSTPARSPPASPCSAT